MLDWRRVTRSVGSNMFFSENGHVRRLPTYVSTVGLALLASVRSPLGFLSYDACDILRLIVPIAGTFVALSFPAAQLAQSAKQGLSAETRSLLRARGDDMSGVVEALTQATALHRKGLEPMRMTIGLSIASFLVGLAGLFDVGVLVPKTMYFDGADFVASLSVSLLIAAALWFIPVVRDSTDLSMAEETIQLLAPQPGDGGAPPQGDAVEGASPPHAG